MTDGSRNVTDEQYDPRSRFGLYRLCDCTACEGRGKESFGYGAGISPKRCEVCRGEGKVRQEVASCETPEAVGVALVTLGREGEWKDCAFGLLDRMPECVECGPEGSRSRVFCETCKGTGTKPTGTWLLMPWLPSPRNVSDAGKLLRSRRNP